MSCSEEIVFSSCLICLPSSVIDVWIYESYIQQNWPQDLLVLLPLNPAHPFLSQNPCWRQWELCLSKDCKMGFLRNLQFLRISLTGPACSRRVHEISSHNSQVSGDQAGGQFLEATLPNTYPRTLQNQDVLQHGGAGQPQLTEPEDVLLLHCLFLGVWNWNPKQRLLQNWRKRALPKSACCIASLQKILQCKKLLKGMKKENEISKKASFSNYMISVLHCRKYESPAKDHIQHLFLKS
ncbi:unnamed protein product [Lepidochelys olivacea]